MGSGISTNGTVYLFRRGVSMADNRVSYGECLKCGEALYDVDNDSCPKCGESLKNLMYTLGVSAEICGTETSDQEAAEWYRRAAELGHADAMVWMGLNYEGGKCGERDLPEAARWYRQAAEAGNARGQKCLGVCYLKGIGVEEDEPEGVRLLRLAAEQGYDEAQKLLATIRCTFFYLYRSPIF